jgi:arginyl-tRNA synthetase
LLRKAGSIGALKETAILPEEKEIIKQLVEFPNIVDEASKNYSPALIANYSFELVKLYNTFYQSIPILIEEDEDLKNMRLVLSENVAKVLKLAMQLLGIDVPERM